jgi:hypothetical protein
VGATLESEIRGKWVRAGAKKEEFMSRSALKRFPVAVGVLLALVAVAAGCGGSNGGGGATIALLLPENETPRYESDDRPDFEKAV